VYPETGSHLFSGIARGVQVPYLLSHGQICTRETGGLTGLGSRIGVTRIENEDRRGRASVESRSSGLDDDLEVRRFQRKIEHLKARYERAIAALDKSTDELERLALSRAGERKGGERSGEPRRGNRGERAD
jgi:hypothetical protein